MKIALTIAGLLLFLLPIGFWAFLSQQYGTIPHEAVAIIGGHRLELRITLVLVAVAGVVLLLMSIFWRRKAD